MSAEDDRGTRFVVPPVPPPALRGVVLARPGDALTLAVWHMRGWAHGATRGPWRGRVVSILCAGAYAPLFPLLVALMAVQTRLRRSRVYLDAERTSALGVTATRAGWRIENHVSRRPGSGAGKRLRARVLPELLAVADESGTAIYLDAAAPALARRYAAELPGLDDAGPALLRGRRMRRAPVVPRGGEDAAAAPTEAEELE